MIRSIGIVIVSVALWGCDPDAPTAAPLMDDVPSGAAGSHPDVTSSRDDLRAIDVGRLREMQQGRPLHAYEVIAPSGGQTADELLEAGWQSHDHPPFSLTTPIDWNFRLGEDRSWNYQLHSFDPVNTLLHAYQASGDRIYLDPALAIVLDWVQAYPTQGVAESPVPDQPSFAWYDMAVGLRVYQLAYIIDVISRDVSFPDETVRLLWHSLIEHLICLEDDANFVDSNNHGVFQAAGQWAAARRFVWLEPMQRAVEQARQRTGTLLGRQFTEEGVHREHSPGYHLMVYQALLGMVHAGLFEEDAVLSRRITEIEEAFAWMVRPDGYLAMLGDTDHRTAESQLRAELTPRSPNLLYSLSAGRLGEAPAARLRAFSASGLVVMRSDWPLDPGQFAEASYLAQQCAFHSRTHKHADDLSFVWYDRGTPILIDAGRYGYLGRTAPGSDLHRLGFWYSDPKRIYVESTRAHNTVEIDGRPYDRASRKPYGSALIDWGEQAGLLYTESEVMHVDEVVHRRLLLLRPKAWLVVWDAMTGGDLQAHDYRQWFQFAPELDVEAATGGLRVSGARWDIGLRAISLVPEASLRPPVRGQREPELQGWWSPSGGVFEPAWSVAWERTGTVNASFATLMTFADDALPVVEETQIEGLESGRLMWRQDDEIHMLRMQRGPDGNVQLAYDVND